MRTIASAWQQQRLAQNAEQIQALGKELYERLCTMAEHVADVGDHLRRAGSSYDQFVGSLDARVMVTARRFRELGVNAAKELPADLLPIDLETREPRAQELRVPTPGIPDRRRARHRQRQGLTRGLLDRHRQRDVRADLDLARLDRHRHFTASLRAAYIGTG